MKNRGKILKKIVKNQKDPY